MNLSKEKREKLLNYLEKLKEGKEDEDIRIILEIEKALNEKKYGLVWEEHSEKVDEELKTNIPVFKEVEERKIEKDKEKAYNFLLEGDNLHSLRLLEKTHKGKIDVIYIDPPYNTGNKDFIYNDQYVDKTDGYSHSKWLSFMEKRLRIAKELLTEEGVIFISIDDNEHAQLKLLCDEVFGGENFVSSICVELSKTQGMKVKSAQEGRIVKNHEYIFIYSKNIEKIYIDRKPLYEKTDIWDNHFNKIILNLDNKYYIYTIDEYIKNNNEKIFKLFQKYNILDNEKITNNSIRKGILINEEIQKYFYNDISDIIYQEMACSIAIPEYIIEKLEKEKILKYEKYLLTTTSSGKIRQLRSLKENINFSDDYDPKLQRVTIRGALWKDFYSDMMNIQKEGKMDFKNGKKPIRLIKQLNKWFNRKNSIVLDFFAGSGTTGHAVVQLNKEDGGNRKYILCTNNENNICEDVTYKRLSNIQEELPHNLKYYKVDCVSKSDEEVYEKLNEHIQEMVNLEEGKEVKVIYDEEEVEKVLEESACDSSVYIMGGIMLSGKEQKIVEKKRIKIKEVPEIYYRNELKELGEI